MDEVINKFNNRLAAICGVVAACWGIVAITVMLTDNQDVWSIMTFCGIMASLYGGYMYANLEKWFNEERKMYEQISRKQTK